MSRMYELNGRIVLQCLFGRGERTFFGKLDSVVHFINNLEEISTDNVLRYRLRTDVVRSATTGNWRRVKGATSFYGLPDNR